MDALQQGLGGVVGSIRSVVVMTASERRMNSVATTEMSAFRSAAPTRRSSRSRGRWRIRLSMQVMAV